MLIRLIAYYYFSRQLFAAFFLYFWNYSQSLHSIFKFLFVCPFAKKRSICSCNYAARSVARYLNGIQIMNMYAIE